MTRSRRVRTPVTDALRIVRSGGPEGVSTMDVGMAVRMGARKTECVLSALRDVGLVRVTITPRPGWVACPPVPDEAKALSDAAWAARGRLRRHAIEATR